MLNVLLAEAPDNVAAILRFFAPNGGRLCDISYGKGSLLSHLPIWWNVIGSDMEGTPHVYAEWGHLPYRNGIANVVLYDPPYRLDNKSMGLYNRPTLEWKTRHSLASARINHTLPIQEAFRVLCPGGIFIAKVQNARLKGEYIDHDMEIRNALYGAGFTLRDVLVYIRLAVGVFRNTRTPQQAFGFYIVGEKPA